MSRSWSARRPRRRGRDPGAARGHVAAVHVRGGRVAPGDLPFARRRVRRQRAREARAGPGGEPARRRAGAGVGAALARASDRRSTCTSRPCRPRAAAGRLRRARGPPSALPPSCGRSTSSAGRPSRSATCSSSRRTTRRCCRRPRLGGARLTGADAIGRARPRGANCGRQRGDVVGALVPPPVDEEGRRAGDAAQVGAVDVLRDAGGSGVRAQVSVNRSTSSPSCSA